MTDPGDADGAVALPRDDITVDPTATVPDGVRLDPGCRIGSGASLGHGAALAANVVVDAGATLGAGVSVGAGAYLGPGTRLADSVVVGPNATVLANVSVATHAAVGAGSVVDSDVPAYAVTEGVPARIVGYRSSPGYEAERRLRASGLAEGDFPVRLGLATLAKHPLVTDLRGSLSFGEVGAHLPFTPVRYFTVFGVPGREVRGEHAHRKAHQLLVCVHGECTVMVNDGTDRAEVVLDRVDAALHLPPLVWAAQYRYSPDAVLLVLCSDVYDAADYIRSYEEFEELVRGG